MKVSPVLALALVIGSLMAAPVVAADQVRSTLDFDCAAIARAKGVRNDPLRLQARVENLVTTERPRIALASTPVLYWPAKNLDPARSCVALVLRPRTREPLLLENSVLSTDEKGLIHLYFERKEGTMVLVLTQVDDQGELHPTSLRVTDAAMQIPAEPTVIATLISSRKSKGDRKSRSSLQFGLQWGSLIYDQDQLASPYGSLLQTLKGGYTLSLDSRDQWNLAANGYATLFHYTQSGDDSPRFFGGNLRLSYRLPIDVVSKLQPEFRLGVGTYYVTMDVPTSAFGFRNLSGPELFPTVTVTRPDGSRATAYLKVAAVNEGFAIRSLSNLEFALGAQWYPKYAWSDRLSLTLDLSTLSTRVEEQTVSVQSFQLGLAYALW